LFAIQPRLLQLLVAGALTYQIAVHVPLLYSHRYSIGAIDLWLVLLTGIGIAALLQSRKPRMIAGMTALILAGVVAGELHRKYSSPLSPEIDKVPHEVIWRKPGGDITPMGTSTFTLIEPGKFRLTAEPNALDIPVRVPRLTSDGNYVLSLKMAIRAESQTNCRKMRVLYKRLVDPGFTDFQSIRLRVPADGEMHDYHLGATLPLALIANGDIRLSLECPAGTTVSIDEISIAEPKVATAYKLLYLKRLADNAHP
jgi:hypothetical protein